MRLLPSDPDIATIMSRISNGDLNLQPDFQRGEVWSYVKRQKLIDTILRDWHIPPIHVIENSITGKQDVLDGQQRLVSIRDFVQNQIYIDGSIQPLDKNILQLDGLSYENLPEPWRRKFEQFTVRVFRIVDYKPGEPAEIFFRLNQPVALTTAEQRNAFYGPARQQIRDLVSLMDSLHLDKEFIGFSNSRMAYDDVIARFCTSLKSRSLWDKVTAAVLADKYRSETPFSEDVIKEAQESVVMLAETRNYQQRKIRFNKATLYSWLLFIVEARSVRSIQLTPKHLADFLVSFESARSTTKVIDGFEQENFSVVKIPGGFIKQLLALYNDRSSSRVSDVSSVVYRDLAIWIMYVLFLSTTYDIRRSEDQHISHIVQSLASGSSIDYEEIYDAEMVLSEIVNRYRWGATL